MDDGRVASHIFGTDYIGFGIGRQGNNAQDGWKLYAAAPCVLLLLLLMVADCGGKN